MSNNNNSRKSKKQLRQEQMALHWLALEVQVMLVNILNAQDKLGMQRTVGVQDNYFILGLPGMPFSDWNEEKKSKDYLVFEVSLFPDRKGALNWWVRFAFLEAEEIGRTYNLNPIPKGQDTDSVDNAIMLLKHVKETFSAMLKSYWPELNDLYQRERQEWEARNANRKGIAVATTPSIPEEDEPEPLFEQQ